MGRRSRLSLGIAALAAALVASTGTAQAFDAHGSVEQVQVTGLSPGQAVTLLSSRGKKVAKGKADGLGAKLFRNVKPGSGYRVRAATGGAGPLTVLTKQSAPPDTSFY